MNISNLVVFCLYLGFFIKLNKPIHRGNNTSTKTSVHLDENLFAENHYRYSQNFQTYQISIINQQGHYNRKVSFSRPFAIYDIIDQQLWSPLLKTKDLKTVKTFNQSYLELWTRYLERVFNSALWNHFCHIRVSTSATQRFHLSMKSCRNFYENRKEKCFTTQLC